MYANEEKPYTVTGGIQQTGLKRKPKGICTDKEIGTREANDVEGQVPVKRKQENRVTPYNLFCIRESGAMVPMKP
jgi:hypothetical protein